MSARRWLPTVLRARQAQEDLLVQQVAATRRDAELAAGQLAEQTRRVAGLALPETATVAEFHAEIAGQQAALASLAAATNRVQFADARLTGQLCQLTEAAKSRRTVEKMHERIQEDLVAQAHSAAQREQDDVSIARHVSRAAG
jgi:flagellar biosynthesis chaperone FliJ